MCSLLSVCSCNAVDKVKDKITGGDDSASEGFANFEKAIAAASSSAVVVTVKTVTTLGELNSQYEVYFAADNSATIKYSFERFYEIGEGPDGETVEKKTGTIYRDKDGKYSEDIGVDLSAVTAAAALNIAPLRSIANVNESGDILTASVPKVATADIFGAQFGSDAELKIVLRNGCLSTMSIKAADREINYTYAV